MRRYGILVFLMERKVKDRTLVAVAVLWFYVVVVVSGFGITVKARPELVYTLSTLVSSLVPSNGSNVEYNAIHYHCLDREFGGACHDCQCLEYQELLLT